MDVHFADSATKYITARAVYFNFRWSVQFEGPIDTVRIPAFNQAHAEKVAQAYNLELPVEQAGA